MIGMTYGNTISEDNETSNVLVADVIPTLGFSKSLNPRGYPLSAGVRSISGPNRPLDRAGLDRAGGVSK
jgi:hypothetical protein